ncbi:hypothetical protein [Desulfonatronovibrio hydrogenovorans]|uniref:hypothetical protein n=1 Tax=Desulfonatronovibrio hydrogenovorans TaxID=53245 RepID=UPI00048BB732|nr:hypothetical protein [Desulfonatronovibrio hydrogenovorans]
MSQHEQVRQFCAAHGTVRNAQIRQALGIPSTVLSKILRDLAKQGWLKKISRATWAWQEKQPEGRGTVWQQIWTAMRINPVFCVADLARQAGTSDHYVRKVLREYKDAGLVEPAGRRPTYGSGSTKMWRLTSKARAAREAPTVDKFQPNPLVENVCRLTRLICTGQATRFPGKRDQALELCEKIAGDLRKTEGQ